MTSLFPCQLRQNRLFQTANHPAASANQDVTDNISYDEPRELPPWFSHRAKAGGLWTKPSLQATDDERYHWDQNEPNYSHLNAAISLETHCAFQQPAQDHMAARPIACETNQGRWVLNAWWKPSWSARPAQQGWHGQQSHSDSVPPPLSPEPKFVSIYPPPSPPPQHLYLTFDPQSTRLFGRRTCTSYIFTERGSCAPQCVLNCCVGIQRRHVNDRERVILFMRAELQVRLDSRPAALCDSFTPHFLPLLLSNSDVALFNFPSLGPVPHVHLNVFAETRWVALRVIAAGITASRLRSSGGVVVDVNALSTLQLSAQDDLIGDVGLPPDLLLEQCGDVWDEPGQERGHHHHHVLHNNNTVIITTTFCTTTTQSSSPPRSAQQQHSHHHHHVLHNNNTVIITTTFCITTTQSSSPPRSAQQQHSHHHHHVLHNNNTVIITTTFCTTTTQSSSPPCSSQQQHSHHHHHVLHNNNTVITTTMFCTTTTQSSPPPCSSQQQHSHHHHHVLHTNTVTATTTFCTTTTISHHHRHILDNNLCF